MDNASSLNILVVEDDEGVRKAIHTSLKKRGYSVESVDSAEEALQKLQTGYYDLVISDYVLEGMSGLELLIALRKEWPGTEVIIITAHGTIEKGVEAMKQGAFNFITKPFNQSALNRLVASFVEHKQNQRDFARRSDRIRANPAFKHIIGDSPKLYSLLEQVEKIAPNDCTVLITGESGTGKELLAKAIHEISPRKSKPFTAINCGAIPENLQESELFGYAKGAFTGADSEKKGLFEESAGGTIFFDEIGEMSLPTQVKLLRCLQDNEIKRLGETKPRYVDVRVLAASNKSLEDEVKEGRFRPDLFYRINVVPLEIPPLRERREDIPLLVDHFISKYDNATPIPKITLSKRALTMLKNYSWPGNIRELENMVQRTIALSTSNEITAEMLPREILESNSENTSTQGSSHNLAKIEKKVILETLAKMQGNKKKTAAALGISKTTLWRKLNKPKIK